MPFTITNLSASMRAQGFDVGAGLMDRWFAGIARVMSDAEKRGLVDPRTLPPQLIDERTVTMAWLLRFSRAATVQRTLLDEWNKGDRAGRSLAQLATRIRESRGGRPITKAMRFGDLSRPAKVIDRTCQINLQRLGSGFLDPIDDLFAAIANASIKLAVSARLEPLSAGRLRVTVDQVGTYLRDTYDFNGDQPLGSWSRTGFSRAALLAPEIPIDPTTADNDGSFDRNRFYTVTNETFRKYRRRYNRGTDFTIFSDVRRTRLDPPFVREILL